MQRQLAEAHLRRSGLEPEFIWGHFLGGRRHDLAAAFRLAANGVSHRTRSFGFLARQAQADKIDEHCNAQYSFHHRLLACD